MPKRPKDQCRDKTADEEDVRERDARMKQDAENVRMAKLYRERILNAGGEVRAATREGDVKLLRPLVAEASRTIGVVTQAKVHEDLNSRSHLVQELAGVWTANNLPSEDIARILEIANEAFDDGESALRWLQEPNIQTGQKPPVSLIGTAEGFAAVESVLRQIQYGVFG